MSLFTSLVTATLLLTAQHQTMPKGASHEEHLKETESKRALKTRGADAMGLDQDATTHHFTLQVMQKSTRLISYRYEDLPGGGAVRIETTDTRACRAVHRFLRYQITPHRTGDARKLGR